MQNLISCADSLNDTQTSSLSKLSDLDLIAEFRNILIKKRERLVLELTYLEEMDRRKLFFHYSSIWAFLVEELGMEDWEAERKIRAARLLRKFPELKEKLESGAFNMTLLLLAQGVAHREKLSDPEYRTVFDSISGMSSRNAARELAALYPRAQSQMPRDQVKPLNENYSEVRFIASDDLLSQLGICLLRTILSLPGLSSYKF